MANQAPNGGNSVSGDLKCPNPDNKMANLAVSSGVILVGWPKTANFVTSTRCEGTMAS